MSCSDSLPMAIYLLCKIPKYIFCCAYNPIITLANLMNFCIQVV